MKLFCIECVNLFLIILNVFINKVDAFIGADYAVCCAMLNGTGTIPQPPPGCTAMALSSYKPDLIAALNLTKGSLPLMIIDDRTPLEQWQDIVKQPSIDYVDPLDKAGVNAVAFDHMYDENTSSDFTASIAAFFDDAKKTFSKMLFGFAICPEVDLAQSNVDMNVLNDCVDFYLLKPYEYRTCEFNESQDFMDDLATKDDILESITSLKSAGLDTSKLIFSMQIKISSIKDIWTHISRDILTYHSLCSKKVSTERRFCYDSIPEFFDKARLRLTENLLGVYIDNAEFDDIDGSCSCADKNGTVIPFKAVSVIAGASQDYQKEATDYNCATGAFPDIRHP